jgi:octaprenyl-diphosphate synthase
MLATEAQQEIEALREFGLHLGMAYQLIDDALDYSQSAEETGKNARQDIAEGKTTLPLIYAMHNSKGKDLDLLRDAVQNGCSKNIANILGIIESTQAIQYTAGTARQHISKAKQALSILAASPYKAALETLSDFVVNRTY